MKQVRTPFREEDTGRFRAGDEVLISGTLYTARDAAHQKLVTLLGEGKPLPIDLSDQIIYYCGPTPAPPGRAIGACGPTTSSRMDPFTVPLLEAGLRGMIGKGPRGPEIREACKKHKAVYFVTVGGAGALIARSVLESRIVAWPELGPEAIRELKVKDFPALVGIDSVGADLFEVRS